VIATDDLKEEFRTLDRLDAPDPCPRRSAVSREPPDRIVGPLDSWLRRWR
jgi:hypothetical protein